MILGLLKPLATLMAGQNIDVLELVVLHLTGSLALLFNGPGRFSL